jgi:peptidoglycan hydrolase CwlO-like protein
MTEQETIDKIHAMLDRIEAKLDSVDEKLKMMNKEIDKSSKTITDMYDGETTFKHRRWEKFGR